MSRLLFWLALVFLVMFALRSKWRAMRSPDTQAAPPRRAARATAEAEVQAEAMLCCAHCGVHYPASETLKANGRDYCSASHLPSA